VCSGLTDDGTADTVGGLAAAHYARIPAALAGWAAAGTVHALQVIQSVVTRAAGTDPAGWQPYCRTPLRPWSSRNPRVRFLVSPLRTAPWRLLVRGWAAYAFRA
jgi:hypothetical protein